MEERFDPLALPNDVVPAEIAEDVFRDETKSLALRRHARLTWLVAILVGLATAGQLFFQIRSVIATGQPVGWLFLPLFLITLVATIWAMTLLARSGRHRRIFGHALAGFILNMAVLLFCLIGVGLLHGIHAAQVAKQRPPQRQATRTVRGPIEKPMDTVKESKMAADAPAPDAGKVLESFLDPQPLKTRPTDVLPESVDIELVQGDKPLDWGRWVTLNLTDHYQRRQCAWSADGKWLFVVDSRTVQQISAPDFKVRGKLAIGSPGLKSVVTRRVAVPGFGERSILPTPKIVVTRNGLVLSRPENGDLLLLDPDTLAVKKRVMLDTMSLVGSARLPHVVAANLQTSNDSRSGVMNVMLVDVAAGRMLAEFKINVPYDALALTADGRSLIYRNGPFVHRYAIRGNKITLEQTSSRTELDDQASDPRLKGHDSWTGYEEPIPYLSHDSKFLTMRPVGNQLSPVESAKNDCGAALYPVDDWQEPRVQLASSLPLASMTDNPRTGEIFALADNRSKPDTIPLQVFGSQGTLRRTIHIPVVGGGARWILADPLGRGLLAAGATGINWLEFPQAEKVPAGDSSFCR